MTRFDLATTLARYGIDATSLELLSGNAPQPTYRLTVTGETAIARWRDVRTIVDITRYWPVVFGGEDGVECHRDMLDRPGEDPQAIIQAARCIDVRFWFQDRLSKRVEDEELEWEPEPVEWPDDAAPLSDFTLPFNPEGGWQEPLDRVWLGLVPTRNPWEVPAYLRYGGWNACPATDEHVAVLRHWYDRYGAEVVGIGTDIVEMRVTRPPRDQESARELAREQHLYCDDIVSQGVGDVEQLAAVLMDATVWFFWWD